MADLTLVQGVADLRLSETTLRRDLEQARRLILNTVRQLERDASLLLRVRVDDRSLQADLRRLSTRISDSLGTVTIPVEFDTAATPDVEPEGVNVADVDVDGSVAVTVEADTTEARSDVIRFQSDVADESVTLPVRTDVDDSDLLRLADQLDEAARTFGQRRVASVTGEADFSAITAALDDVTSGFDRLVAPITLDVDRTRVDALTDGAPEAITLTVDADTSPARAEIAAVEEVDAVTLPVDADTSAANAKVDELGNRIVEVDFGGQPGGAAVAGAALLPDDGELTRLATQLDAAADSFGERFRAGLAGITDINDDLLGAADRLDEAARTFGQRLRPGRGLVDELESVTVTVDADTAPLQTALAAIESTDESLTVPVDADTDPARASITAIERTDIEDLSVTLDADADPARAAITAVENTDTEPITFRGDADFSDVFAEINRLQSQTVTLRDRISDLRAGPGGPGGPGGPFGPRLDIDDLLPPIGEFERAGGEAGRTFGRSVLGALQGIFTTGAAVAGGFLGLSLVRGFQRFTTIRDSVASLTVQLNSATEATQLLDEVLEVVTGTPFNLDQFAEAASNMVAFGIEAQKIPGYLTAISEVAATRGGRANEFAQRLAISFGQVAVQGRITNDEVQQLALTGVPALQILGNALGETTFDVRELISKGLVPANEALDILAEGILEGSDGINGATVSFAGTADALRDTLTGSIGGFKAATARFGVSIIEPLEGILVDGFTGATGAIDNFGRTVKETLGGLSRSDEIEAIRDFLTELPEFADDAVQSLRGLGPALAPLAVVLGGAGLGQIAQLLGPLGSFLPGITGPIGALTAAVGTLIATTPELREEFLPILVEMGTILGEFGAITGPGLTELADAAVPTLRQLFEIVDDLLPVVGDLAVIGAGTFRGFAEVIGLLADGLDKVPTEVLTALTVFFLANRGLASLTRPLEGLNLQMQRLATSQRLTTAGFATSTVEVGRTARALTAMGVTTRNLSTVANTAALSIGAAFSGIALAADDTGTQIAGLVGALGSIAAAGAIGGAPAAGIATISAGVGLIAGEFINARQEAEEFARTVTASTDQIVDDLNAVEIAAGEITFEGFDIRTDEKLAEDFLTGLGEDLTERLGEIPRFDLSDLLAVDRENVDPAIDALKEIQDIISTLDQLTVDTSFIDQLSFGPSGRLPEQFTAVAEALGFLRNEAVETEAEFEARLRDTPAVEAEVDTAIAQASAFNDALDRRLEIQAQLAEFGLILPEDPENIETLITLLGRFGTATDEVRQSLENEREALLEVQEAREDDFREQLRDDFSVGEASIEALIVKSRELSVELGETVTPIDLFNTGMLDGVGLLDEVVDAANKVPPAITDAETATEAWARAMESVTSELDQARSVLDGIGARGDAAAALRGIGESLNEIVNESELRKAEQIADQIERQLERVEDASDRLEREALEFSFNEQIALQNIAEAEAAGATKGALAARRDLERDRLEVQQLAEDVAEEERKLAELQAQADELSQVGPITFGDVLSQQAAERGVSLFDLLLEQPTDEAQQAFSDIVDAPARAALDEIEQALSEGDFEGAAVIAERMGAELEVEWSRVFGPARADFLVNEMFDFDDAAIEALALADVKAFVDKVQEGFSAASAFEMATNLSDEEFAAGEAAAYFDIVQGLLADSEFTAAVGLDDESAAVMIEELRAALSSQIFELIPGLVSVTGLGDAVRRLGPGGRSTAFREGGIVEPHTAHITNMLRVFGEPETGGEAYIPLTADPIQRRRSTAVLTDVAERFGMTVLDSLGQPITQLPASPAPTSETHVAHITDTLRVFERPEPGGEAYIPLTVEPKQRRQSTALLTDVAGRFGIAVVPASPHDPLRLPRVDQAISVVAEAADRFVAPLIDSPRRGVTSGAPTVHVDGPDLDGLVDAVADGVGRAMMRSRKADMARGYAEAVHIEHLHVGGSGDSRRDARRVVQELADLSLRRLR